MKKKITIIDYDMGNIFNIFKSFEKLDCEAELTNEPEKVLNAERLVLPGVGSFENGINNLKKYKLIDAINNYILKSRPLLGICVGMQLLMNKSFENGEHFGLNLIKGDVIKFENKNSDNKVKVPQIGWNNINIKNMNSKIISDIKDNEYMYFLHSYYVKPIENVIITQTNYGGVEYCSILQKNNIIGVQFHPERSTKEGLKILNNFLKI